MTGANEHTDSAVIGSGATGILGDSYDVVTCGRNACIFLEFRPFWNENALLYLSS